uniref:Uncharacterized protein n=1 Tax=Heterorhabditis bacteriophora TaxID=37862 RepID=A0A1I7W768_HETBA
MSGWLVNDKGYCILGRAIS